MSPTGTLSDPNTFPVVNRPRLIKARRSLCESDSSVSDINNDIIYGSNILKKNIPGSSYCVGQLQTDLEAIEITAIVCCFLGWQLLYSLRWQILRLGELARLPTYNKSQ